MIKTKYRAVALSLVLILFTGLTPILTYADNKADGDKPIRLWVTESAGPIGKVESIGSLAITGRVARGDQRIWAGEILQAPIDRSVRVSVDSIGFVTLHNSAIARLSVKWKGADDDNSGPVLIASLIRGSVAVRLQNSAEAYIEASGSVVTSSRGASFVVGVGESGPVWNATVGAVTAEHQAGARGNYMIRPAGNRAKIDVKLNKSQEAKFVVTDEHDKPVPDVPVIFVAAGGATFASGASTVTVTTSALGIASAPVTGTAVGATSVTATIAGTNTSATLGVGVAAGGVLGAGAITAIAIAAGAGVTTTVLVKKLNKAEIKPTSDPVVTPSSVR
jgi:Big-like domain-containing protein